MIELHNKFLKLFEEKFLSAEVFSFVETELTFMFVTNVRVVSVDSAGESFKPTKQEVEPKADKNKTNFAFRFFRSGFGIL